MTREELDRLWNDPNNWTVWAYSSEEDPRVFVSKRRPWFGWTINFGHPLAWPALIACIGLCIAPALYLVHRGDVDPIHILGSTAIAVLVLILVCIWDANRDRS